MPKKGYKQTKEHKKKKGLSNSISQKGRILSEEHRKKISNALKGKVGTPGMLGKHHAEETKKRISNSEKGKIVSKETGSKISKSKKGKKLNLTKEQRKMRGDLHRGIKHWNWKGGITTLNENLRTSSKYKIWRELVFLRDNFTCQNQECEFCNNKMGIMLHPHHIKPKSLFPKLIFNIENGITYCAEFHLKSNLHKEMKQLNFIGGK